MPHEAATQAMLGTGCAATRWAQGVPPEALCGVPPVDTEALQMPVVPPKRRWAQGDTNHADWHSISSYRLCISAATTSAGEVLMPCRWFNALMCRAGKLHEAQPLSAGW